MSSKTPSKRTASVTLSSSQTATSTKKVAVPTQSQTSSAAAGSRSTVKRGRENAAASTTALSTNKTKANIISGVTAELAAAKALVTTTEPRSLSRPTTGSSSASKQTSSSSSSSSSAPTATNGNGVVGANNIIISVRIKPSERGQRDGFEEGKGAVTRDADGRVKIEMTMEMGSNGNNMAASSSNNNAENSSSGNNNGSSSNNNNNGNADLTSTSSGRTATKAFAPEHVFMSHSGQAEVYEAAAQELVFGVCAGTNAAIIAYGQTGSGKTHTMLGDTSSTTGQGIIPRSILDIFQKLDSIREEESAKPGVSNVTAEIKASYVEIYQEQPYDLLANAEESIAAATAVATAVAAAAANGASAAATTITASAPAATKKRGGNTSSSSSSSSSSSNNNSNIFQGEDTRKLLRIREDVDSDGFFLEDLRRVTLLSPVHALDVLAAGFAARRTSSTAMNARSSRSHAVLSLTVEVKITATDADTGNEDVKRNIVRTGLLDIVDLAGSERQRDTGAEGATVKEAGKINNSLGCLAEVIKTCVDNQMARNSRMIKPVPWRNSRLTMLLKRSLAGNSRTAMIFTVSPALEYWNESLNTLMFADRARRLKTEPSTNERTVLMGGTQVQVTQMAKEIAALKAALAKATGGGCGSSSSSSSVISGNYHATGGNASSLASSLDFSASFASMGSWDANALGGGGGSGGVGDEADDVSRRMDFATNAFGTAAATHEEETAASCTTTSTDDFARFSPVINRRVEELTEVCRLLAAIDSRGAAVAAAISAAASSSNIATPTAERLEARLKSPSITAASSALAAQLAARLAAAEGGVVNVSSGLSNLDSASKRSRSSRSSDVSEAKDMQNADHNDDNDDDENAMDYRPLPSAMRADEAVPDGMSASTDMASARSSPVCDDKNIGAGAGGGSSGGDNGIIAAAVAALAGHVSLSFDDVQRDNASSSSVTRLATLENLMAESSRKDALLAEAKVGIKEMHTRHMKAKAALSELAAILMHLGGSTHHHQQGQKSGGALMTLSGTSNLLRNLNADRHQMNARIHDLHAQVKEQQEEINRLSAKSSSTTISSSRTNAGVAGSHKANVVIPSSSSSTSNNDHYYHSQGSQEALTQEVDGTHASSSHNEMLDITATTEVTIPVIPPPAPHHPSIVVLPRATRLNRALPHLNAPGTASKATATAPRAVGAPTLYHATTTATDSHVPSAAALTAALEHAAQQQQENDDEDEAKLLGTTDENAGISSTSSSSSSAAAAMPAKYKITVGDLVSGKAVSQMEDHAGRRSFLAPFTRGASEVYSQDKPRVSNAKPLELMAAARQQQHSRSASIASGSAISTTASRSTSLGNDEDGNNHRNSNDDTYEEDGMGMNRESIGAPDHDHDNLLSLDRDDDDDDDTRNMMSARPSAVSIAESTSSIGTSISGRIQVVEAATAAAVLSATAASFAAATTAAAAATATAVAAPVNASTSLPAVPVVKRPLASLIQRAAR